MKSSIRYTFIAGIAGIAGLCLALVSPASPGPFFERTILLSDGAVQAPTIDANLINPWGLASGATGPIWIASEGTGTASVVRADGTPFIPDVLVPSDRTGKPTGLVFNGGGGFEIEQGGSTASSLFLFVTLEGRILGWNPNVDLAHAIVALDNSGTEAGYTGAALATSGGQRLLFAANFAGGTVDRFDENFAPAGSFTDASLPANYSPFGIAAIDGRVFVTFALRDPATGGIVRGPGNGFIDAFSPDGVSHERLVSRGELDAPWGMAVSPTGFGRFSRKVLVGNFGDGRILAIHARNGHLVGQLEDEDGEPIVNEGIWGLRFGNGDAGGDPRDLFFTAGIQSETHGVFGVIRVDD